MGCSTSNPFLESICNYKSTKVKPSSSEHTVATEFKEDPRIPLTGRQIFLIKRSWKAISRNIIDTGINMFLSLFETHKELLVFFKSLQGITLSSELRSNKTLVGHVKGVMLTIDEAITNLDHADNTIEMLTHVGKTHTRFDGFNPEVFKLIRAPFLLAVSDTLEDRYTAHMEDIYQKAIDFILETVANGFKIQKSLLQATEFNNHTTVQS